MDLLQAMKERHSVRSYKESGLHMQLVLDEFHAFEGFMAHYGKFSGVRNYIALIGRKGNDLKEKFSLGVICTQRFSQNFRLIN